MTETNVTNFSRIEILEIKKIDVVTDEVLEDEIAIYPCTVKWRPIGETPYLGNAKEGMIKILSILQCAITPGIYTLKSADNFERAIA